MRIKGMLEQELKSIASKTFSELREQFLELYGNIPYPVNTTTLRNRVMYKLQELYLGGIVFEDMQILEKIVSGDITTVKANEANGLTPGVRYIRDWKGKRYEVTVISEKKFECEGKFYKSLSAVARSITGTQWNGKIFFGVKK